MTRTRKFGSGNRENHDSSEFYRSKLYKGKSVESGCGAVNDIPPSLLNSIILGSSENTGLPDCSVHLTVTSPPYNVSKEYDDDLTLDDYLNLLHRVFSEVWRVTVDGGRVCINVANVGRRPYIPLASYITMLMLDIGYNMRGEIVWDKGASAGSSVAWGSWRSASNPVLRDVHEYILVFNKGGFGRKKPGPNADDIERDEFLEYTRSIWKMRTESAKRVGHPAPFPVELPRRLIRMYSFVGDVVLDPFVGSGTTCIAARDLGRRYIGYDISEDYVELSRRRLGS